VPSACKADALPFELHPRIEQSPYGPMDKAPAYGAGDSGFESRYGLLFFRSAEAVFVSC
jgi:hypothetical protein